MKKTIALLLAGMMLAGALTACGGSSGILRLQCGAGQGRDHGSGC